MNWQPVIVFYVKTTSWIVVPLVLGLIAGRYTDNQAIFFGVLAVGFGITCSGIYREIKEYKKSLNNNDKNGNE